MPQDTPSRHLDQFLVRFPDGMRDRIAEIAKANGRSMNAEIVYRLQTALEMYDYTPSENINSGDDRATLTSGFDELPPGFQKALLGFVDTLVKQERQKKR